MVALALAAGSLALGAAGLGLNIAGGAKARSAAAATAQIQAASSQASAQYSGLEEGINQQAAALSAYGATQSGVINKDIYALQTQVEDKRRLAMETDARRRQLEVVRNQQRARSVAVTNATAQGASKGSGLQGGYGQIAGQSGVNMLGIQQSLGIGRSIFDLNAQTSQRRMDSVDLNTQLAQQQADLTTQKSKLIAQYAQVQANFQTQASKYGTSISTGQGISSLGNSLMGAAPTVFNAGMNFYNSRTASNGPTDISYQGPNYGDYASNGSYNPGGSLGGLY